MARIRSGVPRVLGIALGTLLAACRSPLSSGELTQLRAAELRWEARGFEDYAVESKHECFCPPLLLEWARIEVVGGSVARVVILATGEVITDASRNQWITIEALFAAIRAAREYQDLEDVEVAFDPVLGYPTLFRTIYKSNIADGGGVFELRNAQALP